MYPNHFFISNNLQRGSLLAELFISKFISPELWKTTERPLVKEGCTASTHTTPPSRQISLSCPSFHSKGLFKRTTPSALSSNNRRKQPPPSPCPAHLSGHPWRKVSLTQEGEFIFIHHKNSDLFWQTWDQIHVCLQSALHQAQGWPFLTQTQTLDSRAQSPAHRVGQGPALCPSVLPCSSSGAAGIHDLGDGLKTRAKITQQNSWHGPKNQEPEVAAAVLLDIAREI